MLVSYSDSEGSDDEQSQQQTTKSGPKPTTTSSNSNFALDRSTGKIKVNLQNKPDPSASETHEDERAAKRPRVGGGGGAFSGFNAMLPAPKRDSLPASQNGGNKAPARKVFSLRTGAEPAFSRDSDAELRNLFAEQDVDGTEETKTKATTPSNIPKPSFAKPAPPAPAGKAFMFKPLSVARSSKKKKATTYPAIPDGSAEVQSKKALVAGSMAMPEVPPKKKISLFSAGTDPTPSIPAPIEDDEDETIEDLGPAELDDSLDAFEPQSYDQPGTTSQPQSLDNIASDLNLSAAERRQLFGRNSNSTTTSAINVVNFNTDAEYAANQQLISSGEQIQHNPVRAIAAGKHSLRQLVSSAAVQKDALEESFASGKRNKREAGNKYGW